MKRVLFLMILGFLIQLSIPAQGASPRSGSDSCGWGWRFTRKKTLASTITRGTTNVTIPPTFGMSSGTIGCHQHSIAAKDIPAANYVATNFDNLKHEIAMGQGVILVGLSQMMGCSNVENFSQKLKNYFGEILPHNQVLALDMFKNIKRVTLSECQT